MEDVEISNWTGQQLFTTVSCVLSGGCLVVSKYINCDGLILWGIKQSNNILPILRLHFVRADCKAGDESD